jgi:hypothetical protein
LLHLPLKIRRFTFFARYALIVGAPVCSCFLFVHLLCFLYFIIDGSLICLIVLPLHIGHLLVTLLSLAQSRLPFVLRIAGFPVLVVIESRFALIIEIVLSSDLFVLSVDSLVASLQLAITLIFHCDIRGIETSSHDGPVRVTCTIDADEIPAGIVIAVERFRDDVLSAQ